MDLVNIMFSQAQSKLKVVKKLQEDLAAIPVITEDPMLRFQFVDVFLYPSPQSLIHSLLSFSILFFNRMIFHLVIHLIVFSSVM